MAFDLAALFRRQRNPRRSIVPIRDIRPPAMLAADLYRRAYAPIVDAWTRHGERIAAEYARSIDGLTRDDPADAFDQADADLARLYFLLTPELRTWALKVETWQRGKWRAAVLSATGIDIEVLIGPETARKTVGAAVDWNVALIKDVSAQARTRIASAVYSGVRDVRPAAEVAKQIREAVAMSRRRSINIAGDQLQKLTSALADERRREAGIENWKWRHSGKKHPREDHKARNGKLYTDKTAPEDLPGRLPFCGCRSQPILILDDEGNA